MKHPIIDLHMHVVPDVDDGSASMAMSLKMLARAYDHGVRCIFCTSHSVDVVADVGQYNERYQLLKAKAAEIFPDLTLCSGCEVYCTKHTMADVVAGLNKGLIPTLNGGCFVLAEFSTKADADTVLSISDTLLRSGYIPIIAHAERCAAFENEAAAREIVNRGAYIQANAYSFSGEHKAAIMDRARRMLQEHTVHFIGSDAHRSTHRPPDLTAGVEYIYSNAEKEYADAVCYGNAKTLLSV